ncbi:MAG: radical SAM protein [Colwellia sp.]|nr:radical SAM protein [Colwellia sp.]
MKKIAFIIKFGLIEPFGVLHLCSMLKKHSFPYDIILLTKNYLRKLKEYNPDVVAYNTIMGTQDMLLDVNREVKKVLPGVLSIFGGVYPTIVQDFIHEEGVDSICVGEGEQPIVELMDALSKGKDYTNIKNLHFKINGEIIKNSMRPLEHNLDTLPFPDRDVLYSKNKILKGIIARRFFSKRGCPFSCNYCFNPNMKSAYKGLGRFFRTRSVSNVIQEMEEVMEKYPSPTVHIQDDTFTHNDPDWVLEFAEQYGQRIKIPFTCILRIGTFNYSMMKALRDAGLFHVLMGVETASEELRKNVLGRNYSNEKVIESCQMLNDLKVKFRALNMIGIPQGGLEEALKTLEFNRRLKPFSAQATIFQPYPGTSMSNFSKEHGYLPDDFNMKESTNLFAKTNLDFGNAKEGRQIIVLQRLFNVSLRCPLLMKFIRTLIKIPDNRMFVLIFQLGRGYDLYRTYKKGMTPLKLYYYIKYFFSAKELI